MEAGYVLADFQRSSGFTLKELKDVGFTLPELKDIGFSFQELKEHGFKVAELSTVCAVDELLAEGMTLVELIDDLHFQLGALRQAGCLMAEDYRAYEGRHGQVITPRALKEEAGYGAAGLKKIGYAREELEEDGAFTDIELAPVFPEHAAAMTRKQGTFRT